MNQYADVVKSFFEKIKNTSLLQRLFYWRRVRYKLIDAFAAFSSMLTEANSLQQNITGLTTQVSELRKDLDLSHEQKARLDESSKQFQQTLAEKDLTIAEINKKLTTADTNCSNLQQKANGYEQELIKVKEQLRNIQEKLNSTTEECINLRKDEEARKAEHSKAVNTFQDWRLQIQEERNTEKEEQLKKTWREHESNVKGKVKGLCQKLGIDYADTVPFRGTPDNTIKLAEEYIVLDAKSPASDDLSNFPIYLKDQAEKAKKYAKQESVKKDIFFIVPSNTLEVLKQTVFSHSDHDVYIISIDVLEPLLLCLQKIETYEFAKQLTPEERENICRIIGRFTHLTKRRIQIDSFFAKQFMEMVLKCDSDLPEDIKKDVAAFEKVEKLNPPSDKRNKVIDNKDLHKEMLHLEMQIQNEGIEAADLSEGLNKVRLYRGG